MDKNYLDHHKQTKMGAFLSAMSGPIPMADEKSDKWFLKEALRRGYLDDFNHRKDHSSNFLPEYLLRIVKNNDLQRPTRNYLFWFSNWL